jgi:pyridoxine 4-dehydrogenase
VSLDVLRRAVPVGIVCVQNAYSLVSREDEDMLEFCAAEGIAWVPYFPLGGAYPGLP